MGLDRSPEAADTAVTCALCKERVISIEIYRTNCGHEFHRDCLTTHFKTSDACPVCNITCRPTTSASVKKTVAHNTRSQSRTANERGAVATAITSQGTEEVPSTSRAAFQDMETRILNSLSEKMAELIQNTVVDCVQRLMVPQVQAMSSRGVSPQERADIPDETQYNQGTSRATPQYSVGSAASDLSQRPDKVVHILNAWKVKFSGVGVSVDNFIYRVEALTHQTLGGNFEVLCSNISVLFEGKATEFYWRHHKVVKHVRWDRLCDALRLQFRQERDDSDLEELIRNRKQKVNETFDGFYEGISSLLDQLEQPWPNRKLVKILRNNLRPEIRHEILNLEIGTVSELREICRRREAFIEDVKNIPGFAKSNPVRRTVAELLAETDEQSESEEALTDIEIEAVALVCWNCRKTGHRYQDCLSDRKIFCYGCGAANTYKPNCNRCSKNGQVSTSKFTHKPKTSAVLKNQAMNTDQ